jgi:hypothetical protein
MRQLTMPFFWDVWIYRNRFSKNAIFVSGVEAVSERQAIVLGAKQKGVLSYILEKSLAHPTKVPKGSP